MIVKYNTQQVKHKDTPLNNSKKLRQRNKGGKKDPSTRQIKNQMLHEKRKEGGCHTPLRVYFQYHPTFLWVVGQVTLHTQ